jgi:hypothetical protein
MKTIESPLVLITRRPEGTKIDIPFQSFTPKMSFEFTFKEWKLITSMALKQGKLLDFIEWQNSKFFRFSHLED